jgi:hypothetical protein
MPLYNPSVVGQEVESTVLFGSAITLTTNTPANITSISVPAGDWEVTGVAAFNFTTGSGTQVEAWFSTTSASLPTSPNSGGQFQANTTLTTTSGNVFPVGNMRFNFTVTTTVYLSCEALFPNTAVAWGFVKARRLA